MRNENWPETIAAQRSAYDSMSRDIIFVNKTKVLVYKIYKPIRGKNENKELKKGL